METIVELLSPMVWNAQLSHGLCSIQTRIQAKHIIIFDSIFYNHRQMFDEGGSVADAIISALLCEGVASAQSTGLGGGFLMTIYIKKRNEIVTLNARDVAPLAATVDMFVNKTETGILSTSVPGELKGYWELHQRYGKLPWSKLFEPVIELCRKGAKVTKYFANVLQEEEDAIRNSETLAAIYINPATNELYQEGDLVKRPKLADTLEIIAVEGVDSLYGNGTIAQLYVEDNQNAGGITTYEDLLQYKVQWKKPISINVKGNKTIYTMPLPGGGPLVASIVNVVNTYKDKHESVLSLHRIVEDFKFAFAKRTYLGDDRYDKYADQVVDTITSDSYARKIHGKINDCRTYLDYPHYGANFYSEEDHGTSHINIIAPNGDAIAVTATINFE